MLIVNSLQIYSCLQLTCLLLRQNPFLKHELAFLNLRRFLIVLLATEGGRLKEQKEGRILCSTTALIYSNTCLCTF